MYHDLMRPIEKADVSANPLLGAHRRLSVMPSELEVEKGQCHSCGSTDEHIVAVHRMYVVPEDWDTKPAQSVQNDIEMWCFSCRTHYPHVQVD
jgi:hypothetical protein